MLPRIRKALLKASEALIKEEILQIASEEISASPLTRIDYLSLVDAETLQPVDDLNRPTVLATAVFYGDVRLIDNIQISAR